METGRRATLTPEMFEPVGVDVQEGERIAGPPSSFWKDAWRRLKKNKVALFGLVSIVFVVAAAYIGPLISGYGPYAQDLSVRLQGSSSEHWFGTDSFGRDLFTRVWQGTQISLYIAFLAAFIDVAIGIGYGAISAYYGGRIDSVMQRIIEILVGIPNLVVVILVMIILQPGILTITFALVITGWVGMARLVRGQVMQLKEEEFFLAARSLGAGTGRLIWKHLIPNIVAIAIINLMFTIPNAIFFEAFLSFIGLGITVPQASLGSLVSDGYKFLQGDSYLLWFPAGVLCLLMISFNLLADGLRDALDPRMKK